MLTPLLQSKSFRWFIGSIGLFILSVLSFRPLVVQSWNCGLKYEMAEHRKYLQKLEDTYKNDSFFWAWVNDEGYWPRDLRLPHEPSCDVKEGEKMQDWVNNKLWVYAYPGAYQKARQDMLAVHLLNESIANKFRDFERRRADWWQPISEDLKKICSLHEQMKRLTEVKSHLSASCTLSDHPNQACAKEIVKLETLIEKEKKPFDENREKMVSKWPYLEKHLQPPGFNCGQF